MIKHTEVHKQKNLQKLIALPFEKLYELEKYYYDWYKGAEEAGYTESARVNSLHFKTVCDAIEIKRGNEEEIWDYLT
ncbi:MAG: hypothetical protein HY738_07575 [Bacteroidia bacterium]|nr:hypothetical protein [Bacteroidia bacterium]